MSIAILQIIYHLRVINFNLIIYFSSIFGDNKRPFIYQEVINLGNEPIKGTEYTPMGRVSEFKFGKHLSDVVDKRLNEKMCYLKNFGAGWAFLPGNDSLVFVDNHDNQRGHGAGGEILTYKKARQYKIANAFMMAWPYAFVQIMSSYAFPDNLTSDWVGPPSDGPNTKNVTLLGDLCGKRMGLRASLATM